jgi:DNA polymerase-3 subunit delta'
MSWATVLNHESAVERFRRSVQTERLASTYLFVGPEGIGKRTFAMKLAEAILCETNPEVELEPCGTCSGCQQVRAKTHPDLILISKPKDKAFIPVETFIGDKEHRRRVGLCHDIGLKPFRGGRKIAIIDDADFLNQEGANCLLKTLEEPPPKSVLILLGTSEKRQLKTIVSRSQVIRFDPLTNAQVLQVLQSSPPQESEVAVEDLASASGGSVQMAFRLAEPEAMEFRRSWFEQLGSLDPAKDDFGSVLSGFVDAGGKDGATKRARLAWVSDMAILFYRQLFVELSGAGLDDDRLDPQLKSLAESAATHFSADEMSGAEIAARCVERSTEVHRQVYANASQANVIEAWLRDLGRISRGETVLV